MAKRIPVEISTTNKNLKDGEGKDLKISVTVQCEVPENLEEFAQFYQGEDKMLTALEQDVARRKANSARPLLRDAESPLDWNQVAQQAVDTYQPGRKGFSPVEIGQEELAGATDMESLLAILRAKGVKITGEADEGGDEETSEEGIDVGEQVDEQVPA